MSTHDFQSALDRARIKRQQRRADMEALKAADKVELMKKLTEVIHPTVLSTLGLEVQHEWVRDETGRALPWWLPASTPLPVVVMDLPKQGWQVRLELNESNWLLALYQLVGESDARVPINKPVFCYDVDPEDLEEELLNYYDGDWIENPTDVENIDSD